MSQLQAWVRRALWDVVPRDHRQSRRELRRRQLVTVGVRGARRGRARPLAADRPGQPVVLRRHARPGRGVDRRRVRLRSAAPRAGSRAAAGDARPVVTPIVLGLLLAGRLRGRRLPGADPGLPRRPRGPGRARSSTTPTRARLPLLVVVTAVNGIAEELFFRGAAYAAITAPPGALDDGGLRRRDRRHRQRDADLRGRAARRGRRPRAPGQRRHPRPRSSPTAPGR